MAGILREAVDYVCKTGKMMIRLRPKEMVLPCAELAAARYSEFTSNGYNGPDRGARFDACRFEPQAPITLRRTGELTGIL
jgi:hypothetical protein